MKKIGFVFAIILIGVSLFYYTNHIRVGKIDNIKLSVGVDAFGLPIRQVDHFNVKDPTIFASVLVYDLPSSSEIRFYWKQAGKILSESIVNVTESKYVYSQFKPNEKMKTGNYTVEVYIGKNTKPEAVLAFQVLP